MPWRRLAAESTVVPRLPVPGSLGPLRVPAAFNRAALEHGEAVVASAAGLGLVPTRVGQAVQWRIFAAERPLAPSSPYEAERALNEVVIGAAATLSRLDVAAGSTDATECADAAPGYSTRQQTTVERAARLLAACDAALLTTEQASPLSRPTAGPKSCAAYGRGPGKRSARPSAGCVDSQLRCPHVLASGPDGLVLDTGCRQPHRRNDGGGIRPPRHRCAIPELRVSAEDLGRCGARGDGHGLDRLQLLVAAQGGGDPTA